MIPLLLLLSAAFAQSATICDVEFCISGFLNDSHVQINMSLPITTGWVGFGIGKTMTSADMVIAWRDANGKLVVSDRHSTDFVQPVIDEQQDWTAAPCDVSTRWKVCLVRKIDTHDEQDASFVDGKADYIWALNSAFAPLASDPASSIKKHDRHGKLSFDLFAQDDPDTSLPGQEGELGWSNYCDAPFEFCVSARNYNETHAEVKLSGPVNIGWMAFGIGSSMPGADMWMTWMSDDQVVLSDRYAPSFSMPIPDRQNDLQLLPDSGIVNSRFVAHFVRKLDTRDGADRQLTYTPRDYVWAMSSTPPVDANNSETMQLVEHDRQGVIKNFALLLGSNPDANADLEQVDENFKLIQSHGWIMFFTFGMLVPLTIWMMRFGRRIHKIKHAKTIHFSLAGCAIILALAGAILATLWVPEGQSIHSTHSVIGIVVLCLLGVQALLGWIALSAKGTSKSWSLKNVFHFLFGWSILILGLVNVGLGLTTYGAIYAKATIGWIIGYSLYVLLFVAGLLVSEATYGTGWLNRWKTGIHGDDVNDVKLTDLDEADEVDDVVISLNPSQLIPARTEGVTRRSLHEGDR
jgi:hypothetical protein